MNMKSTQVLKESGALQSSKMVVHRSTFVKKEILSLNSQLTINRTEKDFHNIDKPMKSPFKFADDLNTPKNIATGWVGKENI